MTSNNLYAVVLTVSETEEFVEFLCKKRIKYAIKCVENRSFEDTMRLRKVEFEGGDEVFNLANGWLQTRLGKSTGAVVMRIGVTAHLHNDLPSILTRRQMDEILRTLTRQTMTNGDRIRAMTDEELADILYDQADLEAQIKFCQNLPECEAWLETPEGIPEHKCKDCLLKWLQQPAKEDDHE